MPYWATSASPDRAARGDLIAVGRSSSLPLWKTAPLRTRATRRRVHGAPACLSGLDQLERHREPGRPRARPLGDLAPQTHGRESTFDGVRRAQMDPMLPRVVVEHQQQVGIVDDLRHGFRELRAIVSFERGDRRPRLVGVSALQISFIAASAPGCADFICRNLVNTCPADCKSVAYAYTGSNPVPATTGQRGYGVRRSTPSNAKRNRHPCLRGVPARRPDTPARLR